MLLTFLLSARLPNLVGESHYIPFQLERDDLTQYLSEHKYAVIVYEPGRYILEFLDYSVFKYSDKIGFSAARDTLAPPQCKRFPCFVGYENGVEVDLPSPAWNPSLLAQWCEQIMNPYSYRINYPEQLRVWLSSSDPVVFGVGATERPTDIPQNVTFFKVEASIFEQLNMNITDGLWITRPADRQILPLESGAAIEETLKTPILTASSNYTTKRFVGGYVLSKDDESKSDDQMQILFSLSNKWQDNFEFMITTTDEFKERINEAGMKKVKAPYFFLLETENMTRPRRWFIIGDDANNASYVDSFVQRVFDGVENYSTAYSIVQYQSPELHFREINTLEVQDIAFNNATVSLITITAPWCGHCKTLKPVLNATAEILGQSPEYSNVGMYWIDGTANDLPDFIPKFTGYPTTFMFPVGENCTEPVQFEGERSISQIFDFIKDKGGLANWTAPVFDETKAKERIRELKQYVR